MKENSIEETIKQLELILKVRKEQKEIIECAGGSCINCDPDIRALTESIDILSDYKRVLKENEELNLKYYMLYTGKIENLKAQEVKIKSQVIPVQTVKDKIGDLADTANKINNEIVEELKSNDICQEYLEDKRKELRLINRDIKTLQSLLDEREDSKDGEG